MAGKRAGSCGDAMTWAAGAGANVEEVEDWAAFGRRMLRRVAANVEGRSRGCRCRHVRRRMLRKLSVATEPPAHVATGRGGGTTPVVSRCVGARGSERRIVMSHIVQEARRVGHGDPGGAARRGLSNDRCGDPFSTCGVRSGAGSIRVQPFRAKAGPRQNSSVIPAYAGTQSFRGRPSRRCSVSMRPGLRRDDEKRSGGGLSQRSRRPGPAV